MKSTDVPHLREQRMAESKPSPAKSEAAPVAKAPAAAPSLARASESGDPAVHQLLAELQTAVSNGNDDEAKAVTKKLADLGFE